MGFPVEKRLETIKVIGLGQASIDYLGRVKSFPEEDGKVELMDLHMQCGGPASTALVTLSRMGIQTSFLGSISDDGLGIEIGLHAGDDFCGGLTFVRGLVRQHRLADDVADSVDVGDVGLLLFVHWYETTFVDDHAGIFGTDVTAIGAAPDQLALSLS